MVWLSPLLMLFLGACVTVPPKPIDMSESLSEAMKMCGIHQDMVEGLSDDFGEQQEWIAMLDNKLAIEMFVNKQSRSFTMLVTNNSGLACLFTSGTHYHSTQMRIK